MEELRVAIGDRFLEAFAAIPKAKQKKVMEFVAKFRHNPMGGGINYEKINKAEEKNFRSVRIDQDYRGVVLKPSSGNVYVLLWVDKHDNAYDWARRHRCAINPHTGVLQLFESSESSEVPVSVSQGKPSTKEAPLFKLKDKELLRLGVPESQLQAVRRITTEEALEAMESKLPVEAFEALYLLAAGTPEEEIFRDYAAAGEAEVDTTDYAAALEREASQRRFHVVGDEMELREILEAPLEKWRVFLHPSQRKLINRRWNGPVRVLGGAGTGKTVVAMHRAKWLAQNVLKDGEKLLFTTFSTNLAIDIQENLRKICSPEEMSRIDVRNFDAWVTSFLKRNGYALAIVYPGGRDKKYDKCWGRAVQLAPSSVNLPDSFFSEEWENVILPQRITTKREYFSANRAGRGVALKRKQRDEIWPVFEEMRIQLGQIKATTIQDAAFDAADLIAKETLPPPYRSIIVDEAQDFGVEMMTLIRSLMPEDKDDLFIVGDAHQRIYQRHSSLSQCGINIRGRGRKLRINYRTTEEIRRFATALLKNESIDDLDGGQDPIDGYRSLMHGEPPVIGLFGSLTEEVKWIVGEIGKLKKDGVNTQDMCVVARTNYILDDISRLMKKQDITTRKLVRREADNRNMPGVRLATMHRVKGLEFKVVFMASVSKGTVPLEKAVKDTQDPVERVRAEFQERALFHVAATRAIRHLFITGHGEASIFIKPLDASAS